MFICTWYMPITISRHEITGKNPGWRSYLFTLRPHEAPTTWCAYIYHRFITWHTYMVRFCRIDCVESESDTERDYFWNSTVVEILNRVQYPTLTKSLGAMQLTIAQNSTFSLSFRKYTVNTYSITYCSILRLRFQILIDELRKFIGYNCTDSHSTNVLTTSWQMNFENRTRLAYSMFQNDFAGLRRISKTKKRKKPKRIKVWELFLSTD